MPSSKLRSWLNFGCGWGAAVWEGGGDGRSWCGRLVGWVVLGLAYVKALRAGMDHFGLDLREELGHFLYNSVFFIFG